MSLPEVGKRIGEQAGHYYSRYKYRNPEKWSYDRFAKSAELVLSKLPPPTPQHGWKNYRIYNRMFDLTQPVDWFYSDLPDKKWPVIHYSRINYRPGNPYGDIRINWELNRLQFLPAMAVNKPMLAMQLLTDWLDNNPYVHGPAYISSMELAIRWVSIYWMACIVNQGIGPLLQRKITGLAVATGHFIEKHLSTHSSAGNHLIIEAVGLFWIGKALERSGHEKRWLKLSRMILWREVGLQLHDDGSNAEQTFWYLGFVLDGLLHYLLLEDYKLVPKAVLDRIERSFDFLNELTCPNGAYPDYGDRDDGCVSRAINDYDTDTFGALLNLGAAFFKRDEWYRPNNSQAGTRIFWERNNIGNCGKYDKHYHNKRSFQNKRIKTYPTGGMTLMRYGKGKLLFRHSRLGFGQTCGHGHADALAVLFFWDDKPILIDLGSGQYNGDQNIRNFFRSTIAHNTIEIEGESQSRILGPFLWGKSCQASLIKSGCKPHLFAEAEHNGYLKRFSLNHRRRIDWNKPENICITDFLSSKRRIRMKGVFHLGPCLRVNEGKNRVRIAFNSNIFLTIHFPLIFRFSIYHGSKDPFLGWRTNIYGCWDPIYSIVFSTEFSDKLEYSINLNILESTKKS